ncbi:uncharacterized protein PFL1_06452 [Pseudozyma flocculosa PF-1]|uniref:Uncharacterized protein n=2 Tax=Pseudozyma flocculosa TaxID=84751 RepID=A0A5C3EX01_9BASI|nr:uncharacterized protein PFL1_06452 [Pseudozyma flocculosa PF-1]EPQ25997.1 hypothetical protein PFL1_06452 [Pseudozyma flocculosa PF-1]SPO35699.1 uncharacterized protein PSFLO_01170 [Pseudozyma flocculosa]
MASQDPPAPRANAPSRTTSSNASTPLLMPSSPPTPPQHSSTKRAPLAEATAHNIGQAHTPRKRLKPDTGSAVGTATATATAAQTPTPSRSGRPYARPSPASSKSSLFKPFKSPLVRGKGAPSDPSSSSSSLAPAPVKAFTTKPSSSRSTIYPASPTKPLASPGRGRGALLTPRKRSERAELEDQLRRLRQADKIIRDRSLDTLPHLIEKWREAGKMAAQDLWNLTGAAEAGQESFSIRPGAYDVEERGRHDDEGADAIGTSSWRRQNADSPPPSPRTAFLIRRSMSEGTREQCAALRGEDDDSLPRSSLSSSPLPPPESFALSASSRRPNASSGGGVTSQRAGSDRHQHDDGDDDVTKGIEQKWNVGRMLDLIGVDKTLLRWNTNEEEFE